MTLSESGAQAALQRLAQRDAWILEQVRRHFLDGQRSYVVEVHDALRRLGPTYDVSVAQVRKALQMLEREGVLEGETEYPHQRPGAPRRYFRMVRG